MFEDVNSDNPFLAGRELVSELCKVLNITGPVAKITVEADCRDVVQVKVVRYFRLKDQPGLVETLGKCGSAKVVRIETIGTEEG